MKIPYVPQLDQNSCALACYTMVAKTFFPKSSLSQMKKISLWQPGYVVWAFKFWSWITSKGIVVEDFDMIDYKSWAKNGVTGLKNSIPKKEFDFINKNTKNLDTFSDDISDLMSNEDFVYHRKNPNFSLLKNSIKNKKVCEVVLDSRSLRNKEGFSLHRVVVIDIDKHNVIFHDPIQMYGPNCNVDIKQFKNAWLKAVSAPELCTYARPC